VIARILLILVLIPPLLSQSWSFNLATDRSELSIAVPNTALIAPIDIDDERRHAQASTCFCIEISSSPSRTDSAIDKAPPAPAARPLYKKNSVFLI
jgi:hypothetical protein